MTRLTTLFPPVVDNYAPAFDAVSNFRTSTFKFYFTPSIANSISQIRSLMLRFRRVNTNTNPLPINTYPYEVMWFDESQIRLDDTIGKYYVEVPVKTFLAADAQTENENIPNYFKGIDEFYKIQVRLSQYRIRKESENSGRWEYLLPQEEIWAPMNNEFMKNGFGKFSEWSSGSLVKPITPPRATLLGFQGYQEDEMDWPLEYMPTSAFNFVGTYTAKDSREYLRAYRFRIYDYDYGQHSDSGPNKDNNKLREDSDWKTIGEYDALNINWVNRKQFKNKDKFWVEYAVETVNGFKKYNYYLFEARFTEYEISSNLEVFPMDDLAKVEINLDTSMIDTTRINKIAILRSSSRTSDELYDEIVTFEILKPGKVSYSDYFIESGVRYKYYVQPIDINNNRGAITESQETIVNYESPWLVGQDFIQCSLEYNANVSSLKRVKKDAVIETIGGKFPFVSSNSNSSYIDMSFSCTLTQHMDRENLFGGSFSELISGKKDQTLDDYYQLTIGRHLQDYSENFITEREFRNKFQAWIQNGRTKIYKSDTEGLILVRVVDFMTTPLTQLGRVISNSTFRMVEIGDVTHENLVRFGLRKEIYTDEELRKIAEASKPSPEVSRNPALTCYSFMRKDW